MRIHPKTNDAYDLLHAGTLAFARAEQQGIRVDIGYVQKTRRRLGRRIDILEKEFKTSKFYKHWAHSSKNKVNIHSNPQLANFLYGVKKIKPIKETVTGKGSTDEEALAQLRIPVLDDLLVIRKLKKVRDTYLESFAREEVHGYIHPSFNLHLAITFRSSSDKPNFQNIPIRDEESKLLTRKALYPRPGHRLFEIDYSSLEVRIAACYHNDPTMIKYIKDSSTDMHRDMAQEIYMIDKWERKNKEHIQIRAATKNGFVFPQFYGDYYKNNAMNLACIWGQLPHGRWKKGQGTPLGEGTLSDHFIENGIKSLDAFAKHLQVIEKNFWEERFPVYQSWKERVWKIYKKYGYIDTLTNFRCSGLMSRKDVINYPVQGSAFHCLLWSFTEMDRLIRKNKWETRIIGQIHDSIILDVHPDELDVIATTARQITCVDLPKAWDWIIVPLDIEAEICDIDCSWDTKEEFKI